MIMFYICLNNKGLFHDNGIVPFFYTRRDAEDYVIKNIQPTYPDCSGIEVLEQLISC